MINRLCGFAAIAVLLLWSVAANALIFSGTFTGIVFDSRINAQDPVNAGNIDGERASGSFFFDTDYSTLPPDNVCICGPNDASFHGLSAGLTFNVHDQALDFASGEGFASDVSLHRNPPPQSLSISTSNGPYWFANISLPGSHLFRTVDPATFNPLGIDVAHSSAYFFAGRSFGGSIRLDGLTVDGYGSIGVAEPDTNELMIAGIGLMGVGMMFIKRRAHVHRQLT